MTVVKFNGSDKAVNNPLEVNGKTFLVAAVVIAGAVTVFLLKE